jgi:serine phosphatase RsbU (regulator of sigma subunit)
MLRCLFSRWDGEEHVLPTQPFPERELAPSRFWPDKRWSYVLMPITFASQKLGVVLLEFGAAGTVYAMLREQIGAALKGAALHRAIVQETTRRERAERERLNREAELARQIQTAILPADERVAGLEWAGMMVPAYEVGGDYYDVLPTDTGCWIGMGDVAGHGLMAGLVMLMIQSMVAATVSQRPNASPSEIVVAVNALLRTNVRKRLRRDDHATMVLLHYENGGSVKFAGFHEEILVWRRQTAAWERLETSGVWVGAIDDIAHAMTDAEFTLHEGDLLVLYSDGAVEAMNARSEQFGVERLCGVVDSCVAESPQAICAAVVEHVRAWAPSQADDISILVARQRRA